MNIEDVRLWCMAKKGVTEDFPFDGTTLVFKVSGKVFLLTDLVDDLFVNVKCEPEKAVELREKYSCVQPGYHMNKKHWNTVSVDGSVSDKLIKEWIDHSYEETIKGLTRKQKEQLGYGI